MPRHVDHEQRRTEIATALWRVAEARGLDKVSLREVATEAGISLGRLQHYFASREEMLLFAMEFISRKNVERVAARMMTLGDPPPRARLKAIVMEMLPVDDKAETGSLMNLSFQLEAARNPTLRDHATQQVIALRSVLEGAIALAMQSGDIESGRDPRTEAALLIALADGLRSGFHLGVHSAAQTVALMESHLGRLFTAEA
ncbi:TetR/AcrR family transcriptional regulator [Amycolatopsis taiwanensis]|uniref:HTH-type transcriptional regulator PksA n=1 Tax=Amycolatopsis taiwanensis TaxID=342230 RepID=A0A9W6R3S9_9PSEU|nr:TetR/AcrR family transcriptional regulator [Amycolatopsis taiwanensis]GLY68981.1 HTH-type transcriptional regulator PksA [Amycolatopsis taiwanensis]